MKNIKLFSVLITVFLCRARHVLVLSRSVFQLGVRFADSAQSTDSAANTCMNEVFGLFSQVTNFIDFFMFQIMGVRNYLSFIRFMF